MEIETRDPAGMGWEQCTPEGSERAQLKVWAALPLRAKLEAMEELCDQSRRMIAWRRERGLPYFDPVTGELVRGSGGSGSGEG